MFDIGFTELLIVGVVALLVVGPERLPEAVKTAALWLGRARGMLSDAKESIKDEIGLDDIRQQLHNETVLSDLKQAQERVNQATTSVRSFEAETMEQLKQSVTDSPDDDNGSKADTQTSDNDQ
ncbi:MAG: Sec-independent protein translocase protein TatB [Pseudomonadales bacterium]|nr:Sec-independent protein translocase protein TatB [Pseudomonadales bacterium]